MNGNEMDAAPPISVVIASKVGAPFIDFCLQSLEAQAKAIAAEVIVVVTSESSYAARLTVDYPWARVIKSTATTQVPALRRIGVQAARGALIVIIEEHCSAAPDWLACACAALKSGVYGAAGGPVADYDYKRLPDWTVYFLEYHGALPPAAGGETDNLNDANIAYPRKLLLEHAALLDDGYWPMALHPTLLAKGVKLLSAPDMIVYHRGPFDYRYYLGQRFLFSRAYAGVRAQKQPPLRRLAYIVLAPAVPFMMLARISGIVLRKGCRVPKFVACLPLLSLALVVMVAGEWLGCVAGPGDALSKVE
ncbi:MAG: glycosyltransferase family 2 protein [Beijerinckiaceae bacterium]|nr:glycosyltransferase family 2 protein [Beijerinckiaceae bacterium]